MYQDCPEYRKEEGVKSGHSVGDSQIQISLAEKDTYSDVEAFEMFLLVVKESISKSETIDSDITGIERLILGGNDKHLILKM